MISTSLPYIGITGVTQKVESTALTQAYLAGPHQHRQLMLGYLVSEKTLNRLPNAYPYKYPLIDSIERLVVNDPHVQNIVHYSTDHPETLSEQLWRIACLVGPKLHGFQLNIAWPDPAELAGYLRRIKHEGTYHRVILQLNRMTLAEVDNNADQLVRRLTLYLELIDDVLFDLSMGEGIEISVPYATYFLRKIHSAYPELGLVVAGGLGPKTAGRVIPLLREFPGLGLDAESRLRAADGTLNLQTAIEYLYHCQALIGAANIMNAATNTSTPN